MKRLIILILSSAIFFDVVAQQPLVVPASIKIVNGKVQDQASKVALAYVTIKIKDTAAKTIAVGITDEKGVFNLDHIPAGNLTAEFRLMGYQPLIKPFVVDVLAPGIDLGGIFLKPDAQQLKELTITGQRPAISLKLDKKVFEVGKDVLSQNGSVNDILNGVPSVAVSPAGGISLRGNSNVLVLINGRRSGLTQSNALDQVPADQIERVEVITNPSSRYDAAGSAGIINIILKKNKKGGFNGQVRLAGGIPDDNRINPSINYKSDKFNLFSTFGIRSSNYNGNYTTQQSVVNQAGLTNLNQQQEEKRHDDGHLLYFGADYFINEKNTITAAFLKNATRDHDRNILNYRYSDNENNIDSTLVRNGESRERRDYNQFEFNYTRSFEQPAKKFTIDIQYDFWNSGKDWNLSTEKVLPVLFALPALRTNSVGSSKDFLLQTDYVQPLLNNSTLEMGLKAENRKVTSDYKAEEANGSEWMIYDGIDNTLGYTELIGSAYVQFGSKINQLSYQVGLRTELTRINIEDRIKTYNNRKNYNRLFPTLNMNYQFTSGSTLQLNYSKRINRPPLQLLYPFNELTDFNAQYVGNPDLNPSYADVFTLGFLKNWSTLTFNPSIYYQYTTGFVQDYTLRNERDIFITTPVNIEEEIRKGIELSFLYNPEKWLQLNAELNFYAFDQKGRYKEQDLAFSGHALTARLSAQLKLPGSFSFQGRYNFTGPQGNAQRRTAAISYLDMGLSKNLLKDKVTIAGDVTNIFNSRKYQTRTTGNDYVFLQTSNPNAARYRLSVVYRFNLQEGQNVRQARKNNRN
jgi:outer membrane receptor protein involved in Fe transport